MTQHPVHPSCRVSPGGVHHGTHHGPITSIRGSPHHPLGASHARSCRTGGSDAVDVGRLADSEPLGIRNSSAAGTSSLHLPVLVRHPLPELWGNDRVFPFCPWTVGLRDSSQRGRRLTGGVVCRRSSLELGQCVAAAVSRPARHHADTHHRDAGSGDSVGHSVDRSIAGLVAVS